MASLTPAGAIDVLGPSAAAKTVSLTGPSTGIIVGAVPPPSPYFPSNPSPPEPLPLSLVPVSYPASTPQQYAASPTLAPVSSVPVFSPETPPVYPTPQHASPPAPSPLAAPSPPSLAAAGPASSLKHKSSQSGLIFGGISGGVAVAGAIVIIVIAVIWVRRHRKKRRTKTDDQSHSKEIATHNRFQPANSSTIAAQPTDQFLPPSHVGPRSFSYEQLSLATSNFSDSELLGKGGFGHVYKGKLDNVEDGSTSLVAVKCISESSSQGDKEFKAEVTIISNLRHRNLVKLKGWCLHERGKFLLVYDYMPNGSLDHLLFDDALYALLTWERRYSIALGLGSALQYLHDECDNVIIHRDIKSSNVLLDECFTPKLGDFGLSRQMDPGVTSHSTALAGTRGYMAPECLIGFGKASRETDVYAFGTVLLELVTGKRAVDASLKEHDGLLVDWACHMHSQGRLMETVDERLRGVFDSWECRRVLIVALACAAPDAKARPRIRSALEALRGTVALPLLPSFVPMITAFSSSRAAGSTTSNSAHPSSTSSSSSSTKVAHSEENVPSKLTDCNDDLRRFLIKSY